MYFSKPGFTCWISFAPVFSFICCWVLIFAYLLCIPWFICSGRWCIEKLGAFHANQISMCFDPHLNKGWGWRCETGLSPPIKYFTDRSKAVLFCGSFMFFLTCVCYTFVRVCLFVPCGHLLGNGWPIGTRLWCITVRLSLSHWYPGSGVVLDCIDTWSLHPYLLSILNWMITKINPSKL